MPGTIVSDGRVSTVADVSAVLSDLLDRARGTKPPTIEPALQKSDLGNDIDRIAAIFADGRGAEATESAAQQSQDKIRQFAVIETAVRDLFKTLVFNTKIESPEFVQLWNLFDIVSILSDNGSCDPALLFWMVEELLDSQTIAGCRKIFDFLESRRERITSSHFKQKQLVILRTCNELLRRLSRAEDTAFCGRVFIFMFQSFPLGDRSSVNLRGEYHVENVTAYDQSTAPTDPDADKMEVDKDAAAVPDTNKQSSQDGAVNADALYPVFWSLQESFSQPKKLFDMTNLEGFKQGLEATVKAFKVVQKEQGSRPPKAADSGTGGTKRKRNHDDQGDQSNAFNPKYLTSQDLFELEISDLSFRRNILVQAYIILEFLLSLSAKAKEKLATIKTQNKSVMYMDQTLSEEDTKWASDMKEAVEDGLKQGSDGPHYHRMVETVLVRDRNWIRWKMEGCPPIELPPLSPETWSKAQDELYSITRNKRMKPPMGSLPLDFMQDEDDEKALDRLRAPDRYELPELESFKRKIADDDFEIEMPTNDETKAAAIESKASKSWRALRIAARSRLGLFDKISDPEKIDAIFGEIEDPDAAPEPEAAPEQKAVLPTDQRPVVISGPPGVGKSATTEVLLSRQPGAFAQVVRHTTRKPQDGEVAGRDFLFVDKQTFDMQRDGDALIEYTTIDGDDYGTSRKTIDGIVASGKVPILHMDQEATEQARSFGFEARFVLLLPPSQKTVEARLTAAGKSEDAVKATGAAAAPYFAEGSTLKEGFDEVLVNEELDATFKALETFIYGTEQGVLEPEKTDEKPTEETEVQTEDKLSEDAPAAAANNNADDAVMADAAPAAEDADKAQEGSGESNPSPAT
ncbi:hypothetical protein VD0002_g4811 [Verticillium dahliae]|uniref:THO complex subunit 1 n=2 Tax=Verticillium dahliae TaxID=27337 RepID=G2X923_VERDV|nr:THO complex subunit 1 [Verticillium dahliae VdLs.17]KAF3342680.1 Urease [Verticillium dahliae VDG2]KAH6687560.1 THO complex subunit 1 [Verticillium dahliae]EGY15491.1 THO complex subunit 1 [Verticillium dahliae VdLs.17]PNH36124.1 hypothetical protein BJF96_g1025 [Verticillium dahliae]PNH49711.1 hypothetical protein VD0003_g7441 [Verticillium dahliae]